MLRHLDQWLGRIFDPDHIEAMFDALVPAAAEGDDHDEQSETQQERDALRARLAECDAKLDRYRATLDGSLTRFPGHRF